MEIAGESEVPYPPRFAWLKRLSVGGVVLLAALGAVRLWWGSRAGQLLAAEHGRMRGLGQPVAIKDLTAPSIPAERNAATFLRRAYAAKSTTALSPASTALTYRDYPPYPPAWHALADAAVAANGPVFPLLRRARACDAADWRVRLSSPVSLVRLPMLNQMRGLANVTGDAALREHVRGNDAAAVELLRDVRHLAWALDHQPLLVSHLVAMGCDALAVHRLQVIAPGLTVTDGDDFPVGATIPDGPATRGQVKALIAELLGDGPAARGRLAEALTVEAVGQADLIRFGTRGNPVLRPLFQADERRAWAAAGWYAPAAMAPDWPAARAVLRQYEQTVDGRGRRGGPGQIATMMSRSLRPSLQASIMQEMKIEMERRMTAVSLAVQLHRADRGGAWPASLDALVPEHLRAVPADPFAAGGAPLMYLLAKGALPLGGDRPLVYSVSENGSDETAAGLAPLPDLPQYGYSDSRDVDQHRDLSRWWPAPTFESLRSTLFGTGGDDDDQEKDELFGIDEELEANDDEGSGAADQDGERGEDVGEPDAATRPARSSPEALDDERNEPDDPGQDE